MPVINIRGAESRSDLATRKSLVHIAQATASAGKIDVRRVWCTFQPLAAMTIGEQVPDEADAILFIDLLTRDRGAPATRAMLEAAARAAAESFQTPLENVWARPVILKSSMVFAGGTFVV